ncbi:hypothetical protein GYMLUDRAFT_997381 [Collybiopsis luxurians FD-317 M1]|uniref:Uncharacterized protein n=1 Tax=Collybiopsis luxurians FD-317 M1 TaxID=944289 RepID=A0A0D0BCZ4_9AGAR|nr:hypothetical protein GYMLUDRAFT_997381 [Collybiopsis luxurians FD-317 M1]
MTNDHSEPSRRESKARTRILLQHSARRSLSNLDRPSPLKEQSLKLKAVKPLPENIEILDYDDECEPSLRSSLETSVTSQSHLPMSQSASELTATSNSVSQALSRPASAYASTSIPSSSASSLRTLNIQSRTHIHASSQKLKNGLISTRRIGNLDLISLNRGCKRRCGNPRGRVHIHAAEECCFAILVSTFLRRLPGECVHQPHQDRLLHENTQHKSRSIDSTANQKLIAGAGMGRNLPEPSCLFLPVRGVRRVRVENTPSLKDRSLESDRVKAIISELHSTKSCLEECIRELAEEL